MEVWSSLMTIIASVILIRTIAKEYLPPEFYGLFSEWMRRLIGMASSYISVVIEEYDGTKVSEVYEAAQTYLNKRSSSAAKRLKLKKPTNNKEFTKEFTFSMDRNEQIEEEYEGIKVWWVFHSRERKQQVVFRSSDSDEKRYYELIFHKKHKEKIFVQYLPHILAEAKLLELRSRYRKIYTNKSYSREYEYRNRAWTPVVFDHPATFDTLALEPELKKDILEDLQRFARGEKYYRQAGRAWTRGYLIYGPPGTGKSSMIAAMANFLDYDIYDLELTEVKNNTELRKLLIHTTNKSIIVIEDIDCSLELSDRKQKKKPRKDAEKDEKPSVPGKSDESETNEDSKVNLSGVLNFTDGLWSCCGSERLFVFTTNHIDRLDLALLRSGRMDKHIRLSFCKFSAFKILARNYLSIEYHELFPEIEDLIEAAQITPADVTEHLMKTSYDPTNALQGLVQSLREARERRASAALKGISEEDASATVEDQVFTVQETATVHPSSGILSKASEEACPTIDSVSFSHSVGQDTATFLASCGLLSKAWEESCLAINSESFSLNEYEGVAYVAFPSFHKLEGFIVKESKYGECNIQTDNKVFSGCLKGNDGEPAFVLEGALKLFLHIMETTNFQGKLQIYTDSKQRKLKPIIFVGHSFGGAVATLATLWILEKRLRQSSPFCITFGCPLVGDVRLVEAVGRENWAGNFCHVVSQYDIVPRILFAPFKSIAEPFAAILLYWQNRVSYSFIQDACTTLLKDVLHYANTVANGGFDSPSQSDEAIKRSPYRPFGTYMFCSNHGSTCVENAETVLKLLHLTMQSQENSSNETVQAHILEHIDYGSVLERVIQNSICGRRIVNVKPESSYERGISLELEAIGVGTQNNLARISLKDARNIENKHNMNVAKLAIELSQQQYTMAELEWYKERCEKEGVFYYDSFRMDMDADANLHRENLARFWDVIIEKWEKHDLPSHLQSQIKWINAGTAYRRLVEPLDIAHYYRLSQGSDNYLSDGRPARHKILQKWMEEKDKTGSSPLKLPSLTRDSCFFAHVEEALKDFENLKRGQYEMLESLEKFEDYVENMINVGSISSDVIARIQGNPSFLQQFPSESELQVLSIKVSPPT